MTNGLKSAVLTVSDTRTLENDTSGQFLVDSLTEAGHEIAARQIGDWFTAEGWATISNSG